jgi:class 3 adenylate cyclase/tetratricopeptide (TPR) repeat protein
MLCPQCDRDNPPDARFCRGCHRPLRDPERPPLTYTPSHLAERILTSRSALEGERKQVTVLLADIKNSMALVEGRDPEEAGRLLDTVIGAMMDPVHRYEGTVSEVLGDGIMALFGAPLAHEDHAARACYAALAINAAIRRISDSLSTSHGIELEIRIGLNSGEVVVGTIGNDLHMDYTAVGQTTHLASRLEQLAIAGTILLSAGTLRLAEGHVTVRPRGRFPIRGSAPPVEVFELVGASPYQTRWHARRARGLTPFVARQTELAILGHALDQIQAGHGRIVTLVGDAGVGKSRLVWEFTRHAQERGSLVLECGAVPHGKTTAYLPVLELLKGYFHIEAIDDGPAVHAKVTDGLRRLDKTLLPSASAFLALLDAPVNDPTWSRLDPPERRRRTLEAVQTLLLRESTIQPVILIVDDLQWIDSETQSLLDGLVEKLSTSRLLLIAIHRPEYHRRWTGGTPHRSVVVSPLEPESAERLLAGLLGPDASLATVNRFLIVRTEGNPFFLEESVRVLTEADVLIGGRGSYRLGKALESVEVPATVHAVLASRIDRLPADHKRLLQVAAVVGKDVGLPLLLAIADMPEAECRSTLGQLQAADFLDETRRFPELRYSFKHALTHEVAYRSLLYSRRRVLHARITEAIEAIYAGRLSEHLDSLAHHALLGESWGKALFYLRQTGARNAMRSAHSEAVGAFSRALDALDHLPDDRNRAGQAVDLHLSLANSLVPIGELGGIFPHLREAERQAEKLDDQPRLGRVSSFLTQYLWMTGDQGQAITHGRRALAIARSLQDLGLLVGTNLALGQAHHTLGEYRHAIEVLRANVETLHGDRRARRFGLVGLPSVLSRTWLVWCLAELGEFAEAMPLGAEAVQIAEAANDPYSLIAANFGVGGLHLRQGDTARAIAVLERALALCRVWDTQLRLWFLGVAPSLGHAYAVAGRPTEAIPLLKQSMEQAVAMRLTFAQSLGAGWLAHAYLEAGRLAEARELALRALEMSRRHQERGHEVWILGILADIAARAEPPDLAGSETAYGQAIALGGELGIRPRVAHAHLGLARLYRRGADPVRAEAHLAIASDLFRAMDMAFGLAEVDAEQAKLA